MHEVGWSKFLEDPECQAELLGLCLKVMRSLSRGRNLVGFIYRKMDSECTEGGLGRKNFSLWHSTEEVSPSPVGSSGMGTV